MKNKPLIEFLNLEADRFHNLAKDLALDLLQLPDQPDAAAKKHTAQMHLIRADSFHMAAKLITGQ